MQEPLIVEIRDVFDLGDLIDEIRAGIEKATADEEHHADQRPLTA
jgi:hypothetical protein